MQNKDCKAECEAALTKLEKEDDIYKGIKPMIRDELKPEYRDKAYRNLLEHLKEHPKLWKESAGVLFDEKTRGLKLQTWKDNAQFYYKKGGLFSSDKIAGRYAEIMPFSIELRNYSI